MRRTASWTATRLRARPSSSMPVPRPDPRRGLAAGEGGGDGGRRCGVADAHLAEHEQVGVERVDGGDRHGDDLVEAFRRQRRLVADVGGRLADADVDRLDRGAGVAGEGADRRSTLAERGEHRLGDAGRVGADLGRRGDAVVGGEDQPGRSGDLRERVAMPAGDPFGDLVEPAQARRSGARCWPPARAPRRLRQRRVAGGRRGRRAASSSGRRCRCRRAHASTARGSWSDERATGDEQHGPVGGRGPDLVDPAEHVAVVPPDVGLGVDAEADLVGDDDRRRRARRGGRRRVSRAAATTTSSASPRHSRLLTQSVMQSTITNESVGERERGAEVVRFLDRRPCRRTLGAVRVDAAVEIGVALDPRARGDVRDGASVLVRQLEGEGALAAARPSDQERQHERNVEHQ